MLTFSPDGKLLAAAANHGQVFVWETSGWSQLRTYDGNYVAKRPEELQFSADSKALVRSGNSGIDIWSLAETAPYSSPAVPLDKCRAAVTPRSEVAVIEHLTVGITDYYDWRPFRHAMPRGTGPTGILVLRDQAQIVVATDQDLAVWETAALRATRPPESWERSPPGASPQDNAAELYQGIKTLRYPRYFLPGGRVDDAIQAIAISPDERSLAVLWANDITIHDLPTLQQRQQTLARGATSVAFMANNEEIVVGDKQGCVTCVSLEGGDIKWSRVVMRPAQLSAGVPLLASLIWIGVVLRLAGGRRGGSVTGPAQQAEQHGTGPI